MDLLKSRAAQELGGGHGELKKNKKTNSGTEPERVIELMIVIIIIILIAVTNIIKWKRTSQLQNR